MVSIAPSKHWIGNDGPWSTFNIKIGTPEQVVQVVPSTSQQGVLVVLPEGCPPEAPSDCSSLRGSPYDPRDDRTWKSLIADDGGPYSLLTFPSGIDLPEGVVTEQGLSSLELDWFDGAPNTDHLLSDQLVAGYVDPRLYIGLLGLSMKPIPLANGTSSINGIAQSILNVTNTKGLSWAYTAGAAYKNPESLGSLTFGGYDASIAKLQTDVEPVLTAQMANDPTRDLVVAINNIEIHNRGTDRTYPLLGSPILAFLNSAEPDIWLPEQDCLAIEKQLGLVWNETYEMYLVEETFREMLAYNVSTIDFSLSSSLSSTETITISLPFSAFDHFIQWPLADINDDRTLHKFALKRAPTPGSTTLGRTFFQEAYVMADYDRKQFKVAQALFPKHPVTQIVEVYPPSHNVSLSGGSIAGIVVGASVAALMIAVLGWWLRRRRKRRLMDAPLDHTTNEHFATTGHLELPSIALSELPSQDAELPGVGLLELAAKDPVVQELDADATGTAISTRQDFPARNT